MRAQGAAGLMLTVHLRNTAARRFYAGSAVGFEVSPISPAQCAPPTTASACDYEILQKLWDEDARRALRKRGALARRDNYVEALDNGSLRVRLVMNGGKRRAVEGVF